MNDGTTTAGNQDGGAKLTSYDLYAEADPFALFGRWLAEATQSEPNDPNAMALATVDAAGMPDLRMVLLKGVDSHGFVFYTNLESQKGRQLANVPKAALLFHWKSLRRQVRVRGRVEIVTADEADAYFATRPEQSRLGAWASDQSRPLASRAALEASVARYRERYAGQEIPRPPHWSGFRILPDDIEFWLDGAFRLHHRVRFSRGSGGWSKVMLYP